MEARDSKGVVLRSNGWVPVLRHEITDPKVIQLENLQVSQGFWFADDEGQQVLTALVTLSDSNGIIAGHGIAAVALCAGLSKKATDLAMWDLLEDKAILEFKGPAGKVWVLPNPDADMDFL